MMEKLLDYLTIRWSGYFDAAYYLLEYPDCRLADVDPLWHFVTRGWREGRNPSIRFHTRYYLETNPDVAQAGINPLTHYLRHGLREGRFPVPPQVRASGRTGASVPNPRPGLLHRMAWSLGHRLYRWIPSHRQAQVLDWVYTRFGPLFQGLPDYEGWLLRHRHLQDLPAMGPFSRLIDLNTVQPASESNGRIAIHLHVFYPDLAPELASYLRNMPFPYDLYLSVIDEEGAQTCRDVFTALPGCTKVVIRQVPNRGRDLGPLFYAFGQELLQYDYIAHFHTKKSLYNRGATQGWRTYLCQALLGDSERIRRIFALMQGDSPHGIVYPQNYFRLPPWANTWLANREQGAIWCARLGITPMPRGYFDYPAGSMFWARRDALAPLLEAGLKATDFPEETGQTDGTLAHTLERLLGLVASRQGMPPGILQDEQHPSWSPWRFDQYVARPYRLLQATVRSPQVDLIGFDVFDTLLCRPLLNPERIKEIVARRLPASLGALYRRHRGSAEAHARRTKGRDVGMAEIYQFLGQQTHLGEEELAEIRRVEEEVERRLLEPREQAIALYQDALETGKPVVLITDMFLPRDWIAARLEEHGIQGWNELYVSNQEGIRKDQGLLYRKVLEDYGIPPERFLMVGDNERSDIQIPTDMGAHTLHLLRPSELARGLPRFGPLILAHERRCDLDAELTLGLVVRRHFAALEYPSFDPSSLVPPTPFNVGYSLVGPLLVGFAAWLVHQAQQEDITSLYFLAREGRLIQDIYECWIQGMERAPAAEYLVLSRRAAGVAAIRSFEDILEIARTTYFSNTIENFLHTRYGLKLDDSRWTELEARTGWSREHPISVHQRVLDQSVLELLEALQGEIFARAQKEREGLLRYLDEKGFSRPGSKAVVDIGYGGSIQRYLNRLLSQPVHGYYLMTDEHAQWIHQVPGVILRGCYCENVTRTPNAPAIYRWSFEVEKLLSNTEPQVEWYEVDPDTGRAQARCRPLSQDEMAPAKIREHIREGALAYARDARRIREEVLPDFRPSCWTAQLLIETFLDQRSPAEEEFLAQIVLDDHYCGRGLVG